MKRGEVGALLGGEDGEGFEEMELSGGEEFWVMKRNSVEKIVGEELAENGAGGDWGEEIALGAGASLA